MVFGDFTVTLGGLKCESLTAVDLFDQRFRMPREYNGAGFHRVRKHIVVCLKD